MVGISDAIVVVSKLINKTESDKDSIKQVSNLAKVNGSITKLVSKYTIEPILICTDNAKATEVFDKVCALNTDVFSGFYMQAFEILARDFGMKPSLIVDVMSTDNSGLIMGVVKDKAKSLVKAGAKEAINYGVKMWESKEEYQDNYVLGLYDPDCKIKISQEGIVDVIKKKLDPIKTTKRDEVGGTLKTNGNKSPQENLENSIGYGMLHRDLTLNFKYAGADGVEKTIQIPIVIKAHIIYTSIENIVNMLTPNTEENKFYYRYLSWRAGEISFRDLIFAGDLVRKYKDAKFKDKDNLLATITERRESALVTKVQTGGILGFEKFFNMLIITADDKIVLDRHLRGDVTSEAKKQNLLTQATAMTLTIIDPDYERVTLLTRDIRGRSEAGFKTLMRRKDNDSSHFGELLKSLMLNKPITF